MQLVRDLPLNLVSVHEHDRVQAAITAMEGAEQQAASVMREGRLVGILTLEGAVLSDPQGAAGDAMKAVDLEIRSTLSVRVAAKSFVESRADHAAIMNGDEFMGLLSSIALLGALGHSFDPLTGLSWSDRLREWGIDSLEDGKEICILFFDLDDFGEYNKSYGHVIGDRVLTTFVGALKPLVDSSKDIFVRYGGDEFVIGTTRRRDEVVAWIESFRHTAVTLPDPEVPVTFTVGLAGGMRSEERTRDHTAAMLDNLINLASKDCLRQKRARATGAGTGSQESRIVSLKIEQQPPFDISVDLLVHGRPGEAQIAGGHYTAMKGVLTGVTMAIQDAFPGVEITIDDTLVHLDSKGEKVISVIGTCRTGVDTDVITATQEVGDDVHLALAMTILAAFLKVDEKFLLAGSRFGRRPQLR